MDRHAAGRHLSPWILPVLIAALFLPGCAAFKDIGHRAKSAKQVQLAKLHADFRNQPGWRKHTYRNEELLAEAAAKNPSVEISLREQRGLLVVDGSVAMDFPVATGRSSHPTPKGSYKILDKKKDYASNLYGRIVSATGETVVSDADTREDSVPAGGSFIGARMPYWMRITPTGVGMHVGYVPGRPASHGCIRLKKDAAVQLFSILGIGAPVTVDMFAPVLGGPVGLESVVTSETAHNAPPVRRKPKPAAVPPSVVPAATPPDPSAAAPTAAPAAPTGDTSLMPPSPDTPAAPPASEAPAVAPEVSAPLIPAQG